MTTLERAQERLAGLDAAIAVLQRERAALAEQVHGLRVAYAVAHPTDAAAPSRPALVPSRPAPTANPAARPPTRLAGHPLAGRVDALLRQRPRTKDEIVEVLQLADYRALKFLDSGCRRGVLVRDGAGRYAFAPATVVTMERRPA